MNKTSRDGAAKLRAARRSVILGPVAALLVLSDKRPSPAQAPIVRVAAVERVTQKRSGAVGPWRAAGVGTSLVNNDQFRTGKRSKADLKVMADGSLIRLGQLSSVVVPPGAQSVTLTGGQLLFAAVAKRGRVQAGAGAAEIKGSILVASYDETTGEAVFSNYAGTITITSLLPLGGAPNSVDLPEGAGVSVYRNGKFSRIREAAPLVANPNILTAPVDSPFTGSEDFLRLRRSPVRLALDYNLTSVRNIFSGQLQALPFPEPLSQGLASLPAEIPTGQTAGQLGKGVRVARQGRAATPPGARDTATNVIEDATDLDVRAGQMHLAQADLSLGRSAGFDYRLVQALGDEGLRATGGRLGVFGNSGGWSLDLAAVPLRVRTGGGIASTRTTATALTQATLSYRDRRGELQVGRQRFLEGPTQVSLFGSMVRQGGREVMDAVRVTPHIGAGRKLELTYLRDAFPRPLKPGVAGSQEGFYGRFAIRKPAGNFGLNLLHYRQTAAATTGATVDFAIPLLRNRIDFYGEAGRDPFRRRLTTMGLGFPGFYERTDFDVYLEYAKLRGSGTATGAPGEFAMRVYRRISDNLDFVAAVNRFQGVDSRFVAALAFGARATMQATRSNR